MTDPFYVDDALISSEFALDGLSRREQIIGRNLANVDTPAYKAENVNFEDVLQSEIGKPAKLALQVTNPSHLPDAEQEKSMSITPRLGGSIRADGNNVDVDVELNQMAETGIRYQAITQLVSQKFLLLKEIAR